MEKWMVVYLLPLEVWMDIFCFPWISRQEFGQIVDKIGNFKFAEHAQFYLHEWGKRTLSDVRFDENGLCIDDDDLYLDIPQAPLPPNIKYLGNIRIEHFDTNTIDFLRKVRPLLTDLLEVDVSDVSNSPNSLEDLRTILSNLAPFVGGIHKLQCTGSTFPMAKQYFGGKLDKSQQLTYWFRFEYPFGAINDEATVAGHVNLVMDWLTNNENGPRLCEAHYCDHNGYEFSKQISTAIRQQFFAAKTPCTFALKMDTDFNISTLFAEFHLENGKGEELHGTWTEVDGEDSFQIARHPANCSNGMQEWIKQTESASIGCIHFWYPTVGSLDAPQLDAPRVDGKEQAEQQQPCSSKDV